MEFSPEIVNAVFDLEALEALLGVMIVLDFGASGWIALVSALLGAGGAAVSANAQKQAMKKQRQQQELMMRAEEDARNEKLHLNMQATAEQSRLRNEQGEMMQKRLAELNAKQAEKGQDEAKKSRVNKAEKAIDEQTSLGRGEPSSGVQGRVSEDFQEAVDSGEGEARASASVLADLFGTIGGTEDNMRRERGIYGQLGTDMGWLNTQADSSRNLYNSRINSVEAEAPPSIDIDPYSTAGLLMSTAGQLGSAMAIPAGEYWDNWQNQKALTSANKNMSNWTNWMSGGNSANNSWTSQLPKSMR